MTNVLVVAELAQGKSRKTTLSAVAFAKTVTEATGGSFDILAIGADAESAAEELTGFGAGKVLTAEIEGDYICESYAPTVAEVAKEYGVVVACASTFGKDLMPRVATKIGAGVASDISKVSVEGDELHYTRPMYAGNVFGTMKVTTDIQVVTVRQSEFEPAAPSGGSSSVESVDVVDADCEGKIESLGIEVVESERPDLGEADVVVSGGRSLKSAENFENVLEPLVDALGAAMGASRAAVDAGYVPNELQVGQTGKVVAPKLYVAVGISGAIQHLAGMKGSKVIVAINKDKEAPIAQVADYFLVADLFDAVPAMTEAVKKAKAAG
ncbi:MAG: electron transfer flavoprotein subunit alpha/FixB family protein [Myxococcales bacterium]|nr:electron transfer flavoprotein subunit alpha/FixB family protein [Myxococcales bacterium]